MLVLGRRQVAHRDLTNKVSSDLTSVLKILAAYFHPQRSLSRTRTLLEACTATVQTYQTSTGRLTGSRACFTLPRMMLFVTGLQ